MKKNILLSLLILLSVQVMSQEKGSHISIWGGVGSAGFKYKMTGVDFATPKRDILTGGQAGIGYSYFFTKNVGITIGLGASHYRTRATLEGNFLSDKFFMLGEYTDNDLYEGHITDYELRVRTQNWTEFQTSKFLEIPVMLNLRKKFGKEEGFGFYFSIGAKLQIPFSAKYSIEDGDHAEQQRLMISGYYPEHNLELGGFGGEWLPQHAFGNIHNPSERLNNATGKLDFKFNISAVAEAGILISLSRRTELALGVFIDCGLLDINKKENPKAMFTGPETDYVSGAVNNVGNGITYNSILKSTYGVNKRYVDKVNTFSGGGKVGLRIKLGKLSKKEEQPQPTMEQPQLNLTSSTKDTVYIYKIESQPAQNDSIINEIMNALKEISKNAKTENDMVYGDIFPDHIPAEEIDILFDPIYFDLNKAVLTPASISNLNKKVLILQKHPEIRLMIFGNTCDLGMDTHNFELGRKRADAARNYLISKGIAPERLDPSTLSKYQPERPNTDETNRMHNRRDDFKPIYPKK